jgi:hypothetical protein
MPGDVSNDDQRCKHWKADQRGSLNVGPDIGTSWGP